MLFPRYKVVYRKSCTLDAWTLGLWTPGRLESGRQEVWILDTCTFEIWTRLDNSLTFSNYKFATKVTL